MRNRVFAGSFIPIKKCVFRKECGSYDLQSFECNGAVLQVPNDVNHLGEFMINSTYYALPAAIKTVDYVYVHIADTLYTQYERR